VIVYPLSPAWIVLVVTIAALGFAAHFLLRHRSATVKRRWLMGLAIFTLACSITFNVAYLLNPPPEGFRLYQNLPFHLCTLMSWLMPITVWFDFKPLRSVAFFPGALAGILALFSAAPSYWLAPLWDPKSLFWVAHEMNAVVPFLLASLGFFRPTAIRALLSLVWLTILGFATLPITLALRAWVDPGANYFYLFNPEGASILELFYNKIRIPILYVLPLPLLVIPVVLAQWGVYRLATLRRQAVIV